MEGGVCLRRGLDCVSPAINRGIPDMLSIRRPSACSSFLAYFLISITLFDPGSVLAELGVTRSLMHCSLHGKAKALILAQQFGVQLFKDEASFAVCDIAFRQAVSDELSLLSFAELIHIRQRLPGIAPPLRSYLNLPPTYASGEQRWDIDCLEYARQLKADGVVEYEHQIIASQLTLAFRPGGIALFQVITPTTVEVVITGEADSELAPHREGNVYAPNLQKDGQRWLMWYGGQGIDGHDRIHLAESNDGIDFKKRGVVIDCGSANHVNDPSVVRVGDSWWMFYTVAQTAEQDQIAAAVSADGVTWEAKGIVIAPGDELAWDSLKVGRPSVLYENGRFRLWYDGQPTQTAAEGNEVAARVRRGARAVGYAESEDGIQWNKRAEPVLEQAGAVHVTRVDQRYLMTGESHRGVWWAESEDGLHWDRQGMLTELSGDASDRFGQVTPFLHSTSSGLVLYFGAAARVTWDGNRIGRMKVSVPPVSSSAKP